MLPDAAHPGSIPVIEVLAGTGANGRLLRATLDGGPCSRTLDDGRPLVQAQATGGSFATEDGPVLEFNAECQPPPDDLRSKLWPFSAAVRRYLVRVTGCAGTEALVAEVHAIPNTVWSANLTVHGPEIELSDRLGDQGFELGSTIGEEWGGSWWRVGGNIKGTVDGKSFSIGSELSREIEPVLLPAAELFRKTATRAMRFAKGLKLAPGVTTGFDLPSIGIEGKVELREQENGPLVEVVGSVAVNFDPLFRFNVKWDILDGLLAVLSPGNPLVAILRHARTQAEKGYDQGGTGAVVGVYLEVKGAIEASLAWEWIDGAPRSKNTAEIRIDVPVSLYGKAGGRLQVFAVSCSACAEISTRSSVWAKLRADSDAKGVYVESQLGWEGVRVAYVVTKTFGLRTSTELPAVDSGSGRMTKPTEVSREDETELWSLDGELWPLEPTHHYIFGAKGD